MAKQKTKAKLNANCKVCNHKHRVEIETALLIDGKASREVEQMLKDNNWETVSYPILLRHMKEHVDERQELIIRYLNEKRILMEGAIAMGEDPEIDEMSIRLSSLKHMDKSIQEASILVKQSAKALREQLALRVESPDEIKGKKKTGGQVVGVDRKQADAKKAYVPIQSALIQLYKASSEELRQTIKTKIDTLGIDNESKRTDKMATLVDLIMENKNKAGE